MKSLFSKLRRKLGASLEAPAHPDLKPPSDWGVSQPECLPRTSPTGAGSEPNESPTGLAETSEDKLHPDLQLIDPHFFEKGLPDNPQVEAPIRMDVPTSGHQTSPAEAVTEPEVENERSARQRPDLDSAVASPAPKVSNQADEVDSAEADDDYDGLTEEDEFEEQDDELWKAALPYEISEEAEDVRVRDTTFDIADFGDVPEFDPQEFENETESAQWEDLLDLDLYEEDPELRVAVVEEDTITDGRQLDDYAARLVSQIHSIKLNDRVWLQGRLKAILEEFPFSASYRALSRLVNAGNSLEELEDACELKCLWREAPWLWSHRRFNRMQRAWETEERSTYRSALSWKLAMELINRVGRVEAERRIFDDWLNEWLQMQPEQTNEGAYMDPRFWSYPAYLHLNYESIPLTDNDSWYYEEPIDIQPWRSFCLEDRDGQIWRFEPKDDRCETGFLSILPHSKRLAEKEEAEAKEENKDA